jgi:hypothetical protein
MNIKAEPETVKKIVAQELYLLWASGKISLAPTYKRKPAKNPKYKTKKLDDIANNNVEAAPKTGATASNNKNNFAFLLVLL